MVKLTERGLVVKRPGVFHKDESALSKTRRFLCKIESVGVGAFSRLPSVVSLIRCTKKKDTTQDARV